MAWLLEQMPAEDRGVVPPEFLLEHCGEAYRAWQAAPWRDRVPEALFLDAILPYASVSETREAWRRPLRAYAAPIVEGLDCPALAAARINARLFGDLGVRYSTQRRRADASPSESIESGLASCSGLSILLVNACRSVGIPARFVGIPLWSDGSGNHSWVEIWDGTRWRFTGAAEATGDELDRAWFTGRASAAVPGDPRHGIYAVTWTDSPLRFPISFTGRPSPSRAIDVTERYGGASPPPPDGHARVRIVVRSGDRRVQAPLAIIDADGTVLAEGRSKDDRFDANDHFEAVLPIGASLTISADDRATPLRVDRDEQLVEIRWAEASTTLAASGADPTATGAADPNTPLLAALREHLAAHGFDRLADTPFAHEPLSRGEAEVARTLLWARFAEEWAAARRAAFEARVLEHGERRMPIWFRTYGERPAGGSSVYISMHGGGGAPAAVNDQQWANQQRIYRPDEGIYLCPRAPTNTWNLWHEAHIDRLFDDLITDLVIFEGADPDRVYLMGYSAGGDGVYQLAPRMADRFAAASMMAGHPNDADPESLRNLPFSIQVGERDTPYNRNDQAHRWRGLLEALAAQDPGGYPHWVKVREGLGHWMNRECAEAMPWMAAQRRELRAPRVVWRQYARPAPRFYWLAVDEPRPWQRIRAERRGQRIDLEQWDRQGPLRIRLDDEMLDLDAPVVVAVEGEIRFSARVPRTIATLAATLAERGDPRGIFSAEIVLDDPPAAAP